MRRGIPVVALAVLLITTLVAPAGAHDDGSEFPTRRETVVERALAVQLPQPTAISTTACVDGDATGYACSNVDLQSFLPLAEMGGGEGNDIWGWTDAATGKEYALMGRTSGTSFVDISDPANPVYLGDLPTATINSSWRDLKTSGDAVFIVSEAAGHGMQVFDLTQLRDVTAPPVTFSADTTYTAFGNAHNIAINEVSGFAYAVGTDTCSGGLHMIDISTPTSPVFAGCFSDDGYTHDVQCVTYNGPDTAFQGNEVCFASNEDTMTIVDVTDKSNATQISRNRYRRAGYTHQAWLTEDHAYLLMDDELDELNRGVSTTTYVWDMASLSQPVIAGEHVATTAAIDHNMYVKGDHAYQANYRAGLRVLELTDVTNGTLTEVGFFDIYPGSDSAAFNGAWSNYPYFESGIVIVSGIEQGLFVLQPNLDSAPPPPPPPPPTRGNHVGDLDGSAAPLINGRWSATVAVSVHDEADSPVADVTVTGDWGGRRTFECTTDATGTCELTRSRLRSTDLSVTFTVTDLSGDYDVAANHDPDAADSDGSAITVTAP
jgi:choice-of-anchor B domain-containing protein